MLAGAAFVEDTIKVTQRLEVRAGFRSESTNGWNEAQGRAANYALVNGVLQTDPVVGSSALTTNRAKFLPEPRVGFAWDVWGNGKTAVRGGFGLYYGLLDNARLPPRPDRSLQHRADALERCRFQPADHAGQHAARRQQGLAQQRAARYRHACGP